MTSEQGHGCPNNIVWHWVKKNPEASSQNPEASLELVNAEGNTMSPHSSRLLSDNSKQKITKQKLKVLLPLSEFQAPQHSLLTRKQVRTIVCRVLALIIKWRSKGGFEVKRQ